MSERSAAGGVCWGTFASPVGELRVRCSDGGVAGVSFGPPRTRPRRDDGPPLAGQGQRTAASPAPARAVLACALRQLGEYFSRQRRDFELPVDWSGLSQMQCQVLRTLQECAGYGVTVSYGELARRAGLTAGHGHLPPARVVGQVMGANRCPIIVPCHRVVGGDGLGGYSGGAGVEIKRWLLTFEGSLPPTLDWDPARLAG